MSKALRNTICLEDAQVISNTVFPENQFVLRLASPRCAARAQPGSFVHVQCSADLPMRRPLSIMRSNPQEGWIELLYKIVGVGLSDLARVVPGQEISILGPIGNGFAPDEQRPIVAMIGGGVGIPPLMFLAERLHEETGRWKPAAFFGSELPFPFELIESELPLAGLPADATASVALIEQWQTPCRLASLAQIPGSYRGYVTELAREWLLTLSESERNQTTVFACGPAPMLRAVAALAQEFSLPSQLCLEEYMACAVGGCAGCAVRVETQEGPAMKRVCVDGPVFDGDSVYPK
jgi:dihydroorotate dehydrogenase electron transfer subunit